jgi:hypothetical protein
MLGKVIPGTHQSSCYEDIFISGGTASFFLYLHTGRFAHGEGLKVRVEF